MNRIFYLANHVLLVVATAIVGSSQTQSGVVTLKFEPKEAYIERRGTEQLVRVMVEAPSNETAQAAADRLAAVVGRLVTVASE